MYLADTEVNACGAVLSAVTMVMKVGASRGKKSAEVRISCLLPNSPQTSQTRTRLIMTADRAIDYL